MWILCPFLIVTLVSVGPLQVQSQDPATFVRLHTEAGPGEPALVIAFDPEHTQFRFTVTPALDLRAVARAVASPNRAVGGYDVAIEFTPEGRERFRRLTAGIIGQRLGVIVNGRLSLAPVVIRSALPGRFLLSYGILDEHQAATLASEVNKHLRELHAADSASHH